MTWRIFALPLVAMAILASIAALPRETTDLRSPRPATITQSSYACPLRGDTTVAAGRLRVHPGAESKAVALPDKHPVTALEPTDTWNVAAVKGRAVVVSTADPQGAGAVGFFATEIATKGGGGLAVGRCTGVTQDVWYLGAGSGGRHFSTLTLTNLSDSRAVADVVMWSDEGAIDAINAEGIVIDPFQTRRIGLDDLAAGEPQLAVRVRSRRGAVAASMMDTSTAVFGGSEVMSPTAKPSERFVVPGVMAGSGGRQLLAFNPGDTTARVTVESLSTEGPFVPTGLDDVKVPAGELAMIDLPKSVGSEATALRLTADQPITASVRMSPSNQDFAYAVAAGPVGGPAVLPVTIGDTLDGMRLLLTAPGAASKVTVTAYDKTMSAKGAVEVKVKAGSTRAYDLGTKDRFAAPLDDIAYVVVMASGTVHGAGQYVNGDDVSTVPLRAAPLKALAPDVRPGR